MKNFPALLYRINAHALACIIFYLFPDFQSAIKDGEERDEPRELESRVGEAGGGGGVKKWEKPVDEV